MRLRSVLWVILAVLGFCVPNAQAHRASRVYLKVSPERDALQVAADSLTVQEWQMQASLVAGRDLEPVTAVATWLETRLAVWDANAKPCTLRLTKIGQADPQRPTIISVLAASCPQISEVGVSQDFIWGDPQFQVFVEMPGGDGVKTDVRQMGVLTREHNRWRPQYEEQSAGARFWFYLSGGVSHILIGIDHLAFVLALLLPMFGWRKLFVVLTSFTVAHSITLGLAAANILALSPAIVEPLIAASIMFVAVENMFLAKHTGWLRHRWLLAFVFGLIHGFGFAGQLRDIGLPDDWLVPALLLFNLGVEAGQIMFALPAWLGLWLLLFVWTEKSRHPLEEARSQARSIIRQFGSALVAAAGTYWLIQRLSDVL